MVKIGDKLSTEEFNKFIYLLKNNIYFSDTFKIENQFSNDFGTYTFDFEGITFLNEGFLISEDEAVVSVTLEKNNYNYSKQTIELTVKEINNYNEPAVTLETITIDLVNRDTVTVTIQNSNDSNTSKIIMNTGNLFVNFDTIDYEYLKSLGLSASQNIITPNENITLDASLLSNLQTSMHLQGNEIKFYELWESDTIVIDNTNEILVQNEVAPILLTLKDKDGSRVKNTGLKLYLVKLLFEDKATLGYENRNYYCSATSFTKTVNLTGSTIQNNDTSTRYYCAILPDSTVTSLSEARVFPLGNYEINVDILNYTGGSFQINGASGGFTRNLSAISSNKNFHMKVILKNRVTTIYLNYSDTPSYTSGTTTFGNNIAIRFGMPRDTKISFKNFTIDTLEE